MTSVVHALVLATGQPQYKGKLTHRSWPELPEEIIRSVSPYPMPPHAMAAGLMGHSQNHRQLLPTRTCFDQLLPANMGGTEALVLKDSIYVYTRLAGIREEHDVGVSRMEESQ